MSTAARSWYAPAVTRLRTTNPYVVDSALALFILARMREALRRGGNHEEAVVTGLRRSRRVVTCAALLLAVVIGAFMTGGFSSSRSASA